MTKQKSRGAKTSQYPACREHPTIQNHVETYQVFLNSCGRFLFEYLPHHCLKWMKGVTRLWLKIFIYVCIKAPTDPQRCSENNIKHHLAWRKNMLPSNKQKLIRFRTIEWVGKAQWNNRKLCLISVSHICPWYKKKMSLYTRVTIEWPIVALRSILASKTSHTKRFLSSKWECLNMNSESN